MGSDGDASSPSPTAAHSGDARHSRVCHPREPRVRESVPQVSHRMPWSAIGRPRRDRTEGGGSEAVGAAELNGSSSPACIHPPSKGSPGSLRRSSELGASKRRLPVRSTRRELCGVTPHTQPSSLSLELAHMPLTAQSQIRLRAFLHLSGPQDTLQKEVNLFKTSLRVLRNTELF